MTKRIRIGSAAVLPPFHNPIQVAEDVATIDVLSDGRFDFGVAKGGPFPIQNQSFKIVDEGSRVMMMEALELIQRLLCEECVTFKGKHYSCEGIALVPRPLQRPIPTYFATSTDDAIRLAARNGYGLMGASLSPPERLAGFVETYRAVAPETDPKLAVSRFYFAARTREAALAEALPFVRQFVERMPKMLQNRKGGPRTRPDRKLLRG